jgi:hypothetical protein
MEIRGFAETDRAALRELFPRAGAGAPSGTLWGHPASEAAVYLDPYMDLEPDSLFVAVVDGALVGYLAGASTARGSTARTNGSRRPIRRGSRTFLRQLLESGPPAEPIDVGI